MNIRNRLVRKKNIALMAFSTVALIGCSPSEQDAQAESDLIDRESLVKRHIPRLTEPDALSPFTVGNGEFAFTVDVTGLQTFPEYYEDGIPLGTMAQWSWHSIDNTENYTIDQTFQYYDTHGRDVPYASGQHSPAGEWLRANPHRLHLGRVGLNIEDDEGEQVPLSGIAAIEQEADVWQGVIKSSFSVQGEPVSVETIVHPDRDQVSSIVTSDMLGNGLSVDFEFPYGSLSWGKKTADWDSPDKHTTEIISNNGQEAVLKRVLDKTEYFVKVSWEGQAEFSHIEDHRFNLTSSGEDELSFSVTYDDEAIDTDNVDAHQTLSDSRAHWKDFWESGGAIDLSESTNPQAQELERRIVLSRYVTAIQASGSLPPAETGLTYNSWFGKFHLEMHWWHGVHYVLWGKPELFERSLWWYENTIDKAREKAQRQGYEGARWPKMVAYEGNESPSDIGVFLIWQQPHPIYYAELLYRNATNKAEVLETYRDIVFETAEFMASYAHYDPASDRYLLGPPLIPGQEIYAPEETFNPTFELSYWHYGLSTALKWKDRLGLPEDKTWAEVLDKLSDFPMKDGLYQNAENAMETFDDPAHRNDHPSVVGAYGMLPGERVDTEAMANTLDEVMNSWNWDRTWGWDYPMVAMSAARLGKTQMAIDALLMDVQKNRYLNNGHNYQDERLTLYLPGNGGLLAAVAMMAAGWEGAPERDAPGFPDDGSWVVKYEGLSPIQ